MTTDVNFSHLAEEGKTVGLEALYFGPQHWLQLGTSVNIEKTPAVRTLTADDDSDFQQWAGLFYSWEVCKDPGAAQGKDRSGVPVFQPVRGSFDGRRGQVEPGRSAENGRARKETRPIAVWLGRFCACPRNRSRRCRPRPPVLCLFCRYAGQWFQPCQPDPQSRQFRRVSGLCPYRPSRSTLLATW